MVRQLARLLTQAERRLLLLLGIAALGAAASIGHAAWLQSTIAVPAYGGRYTEGIVASSVTDITPSLNVLTNVGFTVIGTDGQLAPAAAESWQVSDDGKTYTFVMRPELSDDTVKTALADNQRLFPDITIDTSGDHRVVFQLTQAFAPFLATTAEPIFPVGPFVIASQEKGIVRLEARSDALLGRPFLNEINLRVYTDSFSLTKALASGDIDGVADVASVENKLLLDRLSVFSMPLPRKLYVFFNTARDAVKDAAVRTKLRDGEALGTPVTLKLVTLASPKNEQLAAELTRQWEPLGVTIQLETRTATELAQTVIPTRDYDLLIYGLDFGGDPDPYPFWHSSQISEKGLNLSNYAQIDADRLLEKARQESDGAKRADLYAQFQTIFDRDVPAIELEQVTAQFATDAKLKGVAVHAALSLANRFDSAASWYRKEKRVRQSDQQ